MTVNWNIFGASVRGPGHVRTSMPDQDAFTVFYRIWGSGAVVSDGVGSCPKSQYGSAAACRAVVHAAKSWVKKERGMDAFLSSIHSKWLSGIQPFVPRECAATCLFAICPRQANRLQLGMIGDGLIAVLKKDGSYHELCEDKGDCFSNQTDSLSAHTQAGQWQTACLNQDECRAVLLCTDGVADDLLPERRADFLRHI